MKRKSIFLIGVILLTLSACQGEPETIIETVVHEVTVEVPQTVEVTRQVEVEVEVTRQVEVTEEVTVEVTRIVEVEVTATPSPTPEPTPEPTSIPTTAPAAVVPTTEAGPPPPSGVAASLLQASYDLRTQLYRFRDDGMNAGNCFVIVESDDYFNSRPGFDVSGSSNEVQTAYSFYQEGLAIAKDASLGISQGCRDAIASGDRFSITYGNLIDITGKASTAVGRLDTAIGILEPLVG
jgi:hypothetical protein